MFLNDTESDRLQHIGHQADMLAAASLLADPAHDARVWDEGMERGRDRWMRDDDSEEYPPVNPYRVERQEAPDDPR
jgi:hypothetical protein